MKSIRHIFIINCASWIPRLRNSGSELGWALGSEFGFSVDIVMGAPVGSPLGYSINTLLGLELCNYFGTWEGFYLSFSVSLTEGIIICISFGVV